MVQLLTTGRNLQVGIASPSPSYPQEIEVVTGEQSVVVSGKQLFDGIYVNALTGGASPYPYTENNDCRSGIIEVEPNTTYTISKSTSNRFRISEYSTQPQVGANATNYIQAGDSVTQYTLTTQSTTTYLLVQVTNEGQDNVQMQVEEGPTATPYEPYITPTSYQLSLGDIQLNAIGDYEDELVYDVENDRVYKNEKIKEVILNSSYRQSGGTTGTNAYYIATSLSDGLNDNSNVLAYSNMFKGISFDNRSGAPDSVMLQSGSVTLRTRNNTDIDWSDNTKRDAWLNANTPLVYYVLATPTLTEITDQTLVNQVKSLYNAHSLNGTTIITSNGDLPLVIKCRGLKGE